MSSARPPAWMTAWLQTLVPARDQEIIAGDLLEEYREIVLPSKGVLLSHLWYLRQVASFLRQAEWLSFAVRTTTMCLLLSIASAFFGPIVGVPTFLTGIPLCGFVIARRSVLLWAGTACSLLVATAMLSIPLALRLSHPPTIAIPVLAAIILGLLGAYLGRCTGEHIQEEVFPHITATSIIKS